MLGLWSDGSALPPVIRRPSPDRCIAWPPLRIHGRTCDSSMVPDIPRPDCRPSDISSKPGCTLDIIATSRSRRTLPCVPAWQLRTRSQVPCRACARSDEPGANRGAKQYEEGLRNFFVIASALQRYVVLAFGDFSVSPTTWRRNVAGRIPSGHDRSLFRTTHGCCSQRCTFGHSAR